MRKYNVHTIDPTKTSTASGRTSELLAGQFSSRSSGRRRFLLTINSRRVCAEKGHESCHGIKGEYIEEKTGCSDSHDVEASQWNRLYYAAECVGSLTIHVTA